MPAQPNDQDPKRHKGQERAKYIQFVGMPFQIGGLIYLGHILGVWLDEKYPATPELYANICTLAAVFIAMATTIIQVIKLTNKK